MNAPPERTERPARGAFTVSDPMPAPASGRQVARAIDALRRGAAVRLVGAGTLLMIAAETAAGESLDGIARLSPGAPLVVTSGSRAAGLMATPPGAGEPHEPVAFPLAPGALDGTDPDGLVATLRGLADPTRGTGVIAVAPALPPPDAGAALALLKLARLLPTALVWSRAAGGDGCVEVGAAAIAAYREIEAGSLEIVASSLVPLADAPDARLVAFRAPQTGVEHLAIVIGDPAGAALVRLHSECLTGDLLGSLRCDCGDQLRGAIARMAEEGAGVLLYLAQEGRGIGLVNKLRAYSLQDRGFDTIDANEALGWGADERDFGVAARMLDLLGIGRIRLLTNNPAKVEALSRRGIEIVARVGHAVPPNGTNDAYLATKRTRFGHLLT